MDRQKRSASRVTDYRRYHLSGDLDQIVQGKVSRVVERLETIDMSSRPTDETTSLEELEQLLQEQKESSSKLQQQMQAMRI